MNAVNHPMTAVAEIRQKEVVVGGEKGGHARLHHWWFITWRGPRGAFSSGEWYRSSDSAAGMARECGGQEIEYPQAVAP